MFPSMTGERLVELSKNFRDLTANFKIGEQTIVDIKSTFKGLFAILDIGKQALFAIGNGLTSFIKYLLPAGGSLLKFTGNVGQFLVALDDVLKNSNAFNIGLEKVGNVLKPIGDIIKFTIELITNAFQYFSARYHKRYKQYVRSNY